MHALDYTKGTAAIAFTGTVPWHGQGQKLDPDADLDTWRVAAGLDWSVHQRPVFAGNEDNAVVGTSRIKNRKALVRSDTGDVLSVMSGRYKPVQPKQIVEFYRDLIDTAGFRMHTAGALDHGRRVWALAETDNDFNVVGVDRMHTFLLLCTSYDGTLATQGRWTDVRVVCNNTLTWATGRDSNAVYARHDTELDEGAVKAQLGLLNEEAKTRAEVLDTMARHEISDAAALSFFWNVLGISDEARAVLEAEEKAPRPVLQMSELYAAGPGSNLKSAHGTLWGAVNAVTRYQDHHAPSGARWNSAAFGSGAVRKQRAWDLALDTMAEAA